LFTDAWHPGIINLKYMSELLQIPVTIHALWHAGSYDPQDFLGRLIGRAKWVRHAEKSFFNSIDHNYFATDFHIRMFVDNLLEDGYKRENPWYEEDYDDYQTSGKIVRTGWPMEYMEDTLTMYKNMPKRDLILFPHRIAPEKQVDIFRDLKHWLPQYEFVVCQEQQLTKNEYHNLLGEAKLVFSANLQETLGISCYEGAVVDAIPMVPDRLSYSEMYFDTFKYPSKWTEDYDTYTTFRPDLCRAIMSHMDNYKTRLPMLKKQTEALHEQFFSAKELYRRFT
jgi:glycosyltransferase involved in cell wall biosynthesis